MTISASVLALALLGSTPDVMAAPAIAAPAPVPTDAAAAPSSDQTVGETAASASAGPATSEPATSAPTPPPAPPPAPGNEIIVTARQGPPPGDPLEKVNETSFKAVQAVDKAFVGPVAHTYQKGVPEPIQDGVHNALNNLSEPVNFINFMLQLKPGKALQALARFAINSTIGVAGLFDVAKNKPFHIEYRRNGFANTFGYYGIKQGPFLYLPLIGPTTARDLVGRLLDLSVLPLAGKPFNSPQYSLVTGTLRSIDDRVRFDALFKQMRNDCPDYYAAEREWYLQTRKAEIEKLHGRKYDIDAHLPDCLVPSPPPPLVPYTPSVAPQPAPTATSPDEPAAQPSVTPVKPTAAPGSQSAPTTVPASEPARAPSALPAPAPQPDAATM